MDEVTEELQDSLFGGITEACVKNQVRKQWYEFCEEIQCHNRFFPKSNFLKYLKLLLENQMTIIQPDTNQVYYRARCVNPENFSKLNPDVQIEGFCAKDSGAPPTGCASAGRANPTGIAYLYLASDVATACAEVCPIPSQLISVAEFKLKNDVSIIDLCSANFAKFTGIERTKIHAATEEMMWAFMAPCNVKNDIEYAVTQYIAAFFQSRGIDGLKYASSHNTTDNSFNLVLFDEDLAVCISERGSIYRCIEETKKFQNMNIGTSDNQVIEASRTFPPLNDSQKRRIRENLKKQISK